MFEEGYFCLAHVGFNTVSHATKSRYVIAMKKDFLLQMRCLGCVELFLFMVRNQEIHESPQRTPTIGNM